MSKNKKTKNGFLAFFIAGYLALIIGVTFLTFNKTISNNYNDAWTFFINKQNSFNLENNNLSSNHLSVDQLNWRKV